MKALFIFLSLATVLSARGQVDTVFVSTELLADTLYNGLTAKAPTHYLANKLNIIGTDSLLLKTDQYFHSGAEKNVDANKMYQWLYEMNCIAVDDDSLPKMDSIFNQVYSYVGEMDFEEDIVVVPFGIFQLDFNIVDETEGLESGTLSKNVSIWQDNNSLDNSISTLKHSLLAGPLFDYVSTDIMAFTVKRDFIVGNGINPDSISFMAFERNGHWKQITFDEFARFIPLNDAIQQFKFRH